MLIERNLSIPKHCTRSSSVAGPRSDLVRAVVILCASARSCSLNECRSSSEYHAASMSSLFGESNKKSIDSLAKLTACDREDGENALTWKKLALARAMVFDFWNNVRKDMERKCEEQGGIEVFRCFCENMSLLL
jgi:hypothetical protein